MTEPPGRGVLAILYDPRKARDLVMTHEILVSLDAGWESTFLYKENIENGWS